MVGSPIHFSHFDPCWFSICPCKHSTKAVHNPLCFQARPWKVCRLFEFDFEAKAKHPAPQGRAVFTFQEAHSKRPCRRSEPFLLALLNHYPPWLFFLLFHKQLPKSVFTNALNNYCVFNVCQFVTTVFPVEAVEWILSLMLDGSAWNNFMSQSSLKLTFKSLIIYWYL